MADERNIRSVEEFECDYCANCKKRPNCAYVTRERTDLCQELFFVGLGYEKCLEETIKVFRMKRRRNEKT